MYVGSTSRENARLQQLSGGLRLFTAIDKIGNLGGALSPFNLFGRAVSGLVEHWGTAPPGVPACLLKAFQADRYPDTIHDMDRCAAAAVLFAAVMAGRSSVERLVTHIEGFVEGERTTLLDAVKADLGARGSGLTTKTVCYLQDLLLDRNESEWGSSDEDFKRMVQGAGFQVDHEVFGSTSDRIFGLEPEEMLGIQVPSRGAGRSTPRTLCWSVDGPTVSSTSSTPAFRLQRWRTATPTPASTPTPCSSTTSSSSPP